MRKKIIKLFTLTSFLVFLLLPIKQPIEAALPDIILDETHQSIDINRWDPFFVYFHYGNSTSTKSVSNAALNVKIEGSGVEIIPDQVYDLYYNPTQIPACNASYSGPTFPVKSDLITSQNLIYGPRSATTESESSGESSSTLKIGTTGCLKVGLQLTKEAKIGDVASIIFDPDVNESEDYTEDLRPGKQIVRLSVGNKEQCTTDQEELVNGKCVQKCAEKEIRNDKGECAVTEKNCPENQELFNYKCMEKCSGNEERNSFGNCVKIEEPKDTEVSRFLNVLVVAIIILIATTIFFKIKNIFKR